MIRGGFDMSILVDILLVLVFGAFLFFFTKFGLDKALYLIGNAWLALAVSLIIGQMITNFLEDLFIRDMVTNAVHGSLADLIAHNANGYNLAELFANLPENFVNFLDGLGASLTALEAEFGSYTVASDDIIRVMAERIAAGMTVALISDAGTPCISDPGFMLVRACVEKGVEVQCLPGATAFVPALVDSGLPNDRFYFEGFLPQKKGRQTRMKILAEQTHTMIIYESPFRLVKTLEQLAEFMGGERRASVSREISKLHEDTQRGTLLELAAHYKQTPPKGEIVLIVEGKTDK